MIRFISRMMIPNLMMRTTEQNTDYFKDVSLDDKNVSNLGEDFDFDDINPT